MTAFQEFFNRQPVIVQIAIALLLVGVVMPLVSPYYACRYMIMHPRLVVLRLTQWSLFLGAAFAGLCLLVWIGHQMDKAEASRVECVMVRGHVVCGEPVHY